VAVNKKVDVGLNEHLIEKH